jgi:hypothetical protein
MAAGPGKYDALATTVREAARARAVVLIVVDGEHGSGFSVQMREAVALAPAVICCPLALPAMLRRIADAIEADAGHA